jgi:replicative DNA helicase
VQPSAEETESRHLTRTSPPHNLEAEQALLGAILINNAALDRVSGFLEARHLFDPLHQQIYETLSKLIAAGKPATPITLRTFFENAEPIDAATTVPVYLGKLVINATTIINAREYARTIHDLYTRRQLIIIGEDLVNKAYDSPVDFPPKEQIDEAEERLFLLAEAGDNERAVKTAHSAIMAAIDQADVVQRKGNGLCGIATGIQVLDAKLGGLAPSDLIVVAGRPSMGKTTLAATFAENAARAGHYVYLASLEMSASQIGARYVAGAVGMSAFDLRRGIGVADRMSDLLMEAQRWADVPLHIDESGALTIGQLTTRVRRAHRKRAVHLVVVDYLQLLRGSIYRGKNRVEEIGEISGGLKGLAKDLGIPVIAVSQLNRAADVREDHRPQLSDLRASGDIEQDADVVMFVYREDYYLERQPPDSCDGPRTLEWQRRLGAARGRAEVIHGPIGMVNVAFSPATARFADLANDGVGA